jgi:hypothetical protein
VADGQGSALQLLSNSSGELKTFFRLVPPFANASKPALSSLAAASRTGRKMIPPLRPIVAQLNNVARRTPELSGNLAQVLSDLDNRKRAVENDPRAARQIGKPGSKAGYTGLEALLQYVFNQAVAINAFDQNGHLLRVNAVVSSKCGPYAAKNKYPECRAWVGPNQPGITSPDTSDKSSIPAGGDGSVSSGPLSPSGSPPLPSLPTLLRKALAANAAEGSKTPTAKSAAPASSGTPKTSAAGSDPSSDLLNYLLAP